MAGYCPCRPDPSAAHLTNQRASELMPRGRVLPAVVALSTAVACSEPTDVRLPAAYAGAASRASADANVIHVASGDRGVMGVFGNVTVYGSGYGSAVAFAPNGS